MNRVARLRLRVIEKVSRRTYLAIWPWSDGIGFCIATGTRHIISRYAGYREYNDRGEPVPDSWTEPQELVRLA